MANVTGINIDPILERLNGTAEYHPFDADTFADWATEAGDVAEIIRDGVAYKSPIHTSRMVWKGKAPSMQLRSTGNEKRDPVAKISRKKYGRGSAGIRSNEQIHRNFYSEDGILHSELHVTESYLRTEFHNETNSLRSYFDMTASGLRTEFIDEVNSLRGDFEVTASGLRTEFNDMGNSLRGEFQVTASGLRTEFTDDMNSLRGEFQVTASGLRTEFISEMTSMRGEFEVTASGLRTAFESEMTSMRGEFEVTASGLRTAFESEMTSMRGEFEVTASGLRTAFESEMTSMRGEFEVTASGLRTAFESETGSLRTDFEVTSSGLNTRVSKVVDDNGNIKSARICVAINNDNSSQAVIEADKIYLLGQTIMDTVDADYIDSKVADIPILHGMSASFSGSIRVGSTIYLGNDPEDISGNLANAIKELRITRSGNTYTLQKKDYNDSDWVDVDSFSRATTLSAGWDGNLVFTVGASPQGNSRYTSIVSAVPQSDQTWSGTIGTLPLKATIDGGETTVNVGNITVNVSNVLQTKTGANKITTNGTYTPDTGYIGFSEIEIDVSGGTPAPTTIGTSWNNGILTITASPQGTTETRVLQQKASTWSGDVATIPIESRYGSTQQYTEGVVYSATIDVSSKLTSARNTASANVTLLAPTANAKTSGIDSSRVFTVSTTGRKNTSGTTENLEEEVPLHLYWDGAFSSNVATVYMKWGSTPGSSGTNYAKATVDASTLVTNAGYAGRAAVTISDTLTWTTNPASNITVSNNTITVRTTGRTNSSGTTSESSLPIHLYTNVGSWGTPSANKCYVYVTYNDSNDTSRIIRREVDATSIVESAANNVRIGTPVWATSPASDVTVDTNTATFSTTASTPTSRDLIILLKQGDFSSHKKYVYAHHINDNAGNRIARIQVDATSEYNAGRAAVTLNDPTWNAITGPVPENRTVTVSTTGRTNASGTTENLPKSVALYLTKGNWSSNKLTVFMRTVSTTGTVYAQTEVDASSIYNAGWTAAANKVAFPTAEKTDSNTISISYPTSTVGGSSSKSIWVSDMAKDYADIRMAIDGTNTTIARVTHNRYTGGWTAARSSVVNKTYTVGGKTYNYNPTAAVAAANRLDYIIAAVPSATVDGTLIERKYVLTSGDNVAYIRYNASDGSILAQYTHNKKNEGRAAVTLLDVSADAKTSGIDSSRIFTVATTGRTNASGTTENLDKKVPLHLYWNETFSSNVATVYMKWGSTPGSSGTNYAKATVDASSIYENGWKAYNTAFKWPEEPEDPNTVFSIKRPSSTPDSASDAVIRNYTLENNGNNAVYLRYGGKTYAEITHDKYTAGWTNARSSVVNKTYTAGGKTYNYNPTAAVAAANRLDYIIAAVPSATVDGTLIERKYVLTSGDNVAYIRYNESDGSILAQYTHNKKNEGRAAVTLLAPTANAKTSGIDSSRIFTVATTGRTDASGTTKNLSEEVPLHLYWDGTFSSNVATVYMKWGSTPGSSGTNYAKATVDASSIYTTGYANATPSSITFLTQATGNTWNVRITKADGTTKDIVSDVSRIANDSAWFTPTSKGSNHQASLQPGSYISPGAARTYRTNYTWYVPKGKIAETSAEGSTHMGTLKSNQLYELFYEKDPEGTTGSGITFRTPTASSPSYTVTVSGTGSFYANTPGGASEVLKGWNPKLISNLPAVVSQGYRYIKFTVDGKQRSFYFAN